MQRLIEITGLIPVEYPTTRHGSTPEERALFEIGHTSVYWSKLDCDISSDCLLRGANL